MKEWNTGLMAHLGMHFVEVGPDKVVLELQARETLATVGGAAAMGGTLRAEATPLHKGRRTHVWQTRVTDANGRLLSLTIQTQMIL